MLRENIHAQDLYCVKLADELNYNLRTINCDFGDHGWVVHGGAVSWKIRAPIFIQAGAGGGEFYL